MKEYDVVVIGAGSAGMVAASQAASMGAKTAITEKWKLGGDCPNRACIPTKALLYSAKLLSKFRQAEKYGLKADNVGFDWLKVQEWKNKVVEERVSKESEANLKAQGIDLYWGQASFHFSVIAVLAPMLAAWDAATIPALPAPITTTS